MQGKDLKIKIYLFGQEIREIKEISQDIRKSVRNYKSEKNGNQIKNYMK